MKTVLCVAVAAVLSALTLAADAADAPEAPRKAKVPMTTASGVNPAVQATQNSAVPGDLRPENPVVPQVKIPLRRAASEPDARTSGTLARGGIDDRVARCQARVSPQERAACNAQNAASPASAATPAAPR